VLLAGTMIKDMIPLHSVQI